MYIGSQFGEQTDEEMKVLSQLGIKNVDQTPARLGGNGARTCCCR